MMTEFPEITGEVKISFTVTVSGDGTIDADDLEAKLKEEAQRIEAHCRDLTPRFPGGDIKISTEFSGAEIR